MDEKRRTTSQRISSRTSAPTRRSASGQRRASVHGSAPAAPRATASQRPARPTASSAAVKQSPKWRGIALMAVGALALVLGISALVRSCDSPAAGTPSVMNKADASVSFVAVGDNLPDNVLANYAWDQGGDHYDYKPIYEFIQPLVQAADVAYVKEEVHLDDELGVHGYPSFNAPESLADDLNWWEVNFISEDRLTRDITRAHELAEVVIVAMHWGTENFTGIDDYQAKYARLLANLNVDIVLGSHPHVIGPVE